MKSKLSNCEANRTKIAEIRPIHRDNRSLQNDADLKTKFKICNMDVHIKFHEESKNLLYFNLRSYQM